jgi:hypothetical protein
VDRYAKAIIGAIVSGLMAYQTAVLGDRIVSPEEWANVAIAVVAGLALIWAVPNAPATRLGEHT